MSDTTGNSGRRGRSPDQDVSSAQQGADDSAHRAAADPDPGAHRNLQRFFSILRALSDAPPGGLRAVDVSHAIGLGRATTHRLLVGLASRGIVELNSKSSCFTLSRLAVRWGLAALNRHGLAEAGLHSVRELSDTTGDTAYLAIRSADSAECVDYAEGAFPIKALIMQVGDRTPLVEGALGLAIIAQLPDQEVETLIQRAKQSGCDIDRALLVANIARTRETGVAVDETTTGIASLAAPIRGRMGEALGAISLSAIATRFVDGRRDRLIPLLRDAAAKIERALFDRRG